MSFNRSTILLQIHLALLTVVAAFNATPNVADDVTSAQMNDSSALSDRIARLEQQNRELADSFEGLANSYRTFVSSNDALLKRLDALSFASGATLFCLWSHSSVDGVPVHFTLCFKFRRYRGSDTKQ